MKRILAAVTLVSVCAIALVGCYKVDNPDFCCTSTESCAAKGVTAPDGCPTGLVCDDAKYTCVDPGNGGDCVTPDQCSTVTPFCVMGTCKQCQDTLGCTATVPVCSADNVCTGCAGESDCTTYTSTPHCVTSGAMMGACVACRDSKDCTTSTAPVCDQAACRACKVDSECDSGFCDADTGACAGENDVVYLSPTGQAGSCTKPSPCNTFGQGLGAVAGTRTHMLVAPGTYQDPDTGVVITKNVSIHAFGADMKPHSSGEPVLEITNTAQVVIDGLRVHGGGDTSGMGVYIHNNNSVHPNATLRRMKIDTNAGGGVSIMASEFTLENDFIVNNGLGSPFGGVLISQISSAGTHAFLFNTLSGNSAPSGTDAGVECSLVSTPLAFADSIVFGNNATGGAKQVGGANCSWTYSDISDAVTGTGNVMGNPMFQDSGNADFHIASGSAAQDTADPAATLVVDYDGDVRPQGTHPDMGADELE